MPSQRHIDPTADIARDPSETSSDEVDMVAIMNEMTVEERRRVYALQANLKAYLELRKKMRLEIAALANENAAEVQKLCATRKAIVTGARDITAAELERIGTTATAPPAEPAKGTAPAKKGVTVVDPVDAKQSSALEAAAASPTGGIPNFWLTAMSNSESVNGMITEKDRDALAHLTDIEREFVDGDPEKGDRLIFHFSPNAYFSNESLTKDYLTEYDEDHGEPRITDVVGCSIDWKSAKKNLTVTVKQKKQRNKKTGQVRVVEREEACESFFNFFSPPNPDDDNDDDDEDEGFAEQEMEMDVEVGTALTQGVVPRAIYYYTGEAVVDTGKELMGQFGFGEEDEEEEDDEDEEEEEEEEEDGGKTNFRNIVRQRGGGGGGRGGRGSGAAAQPPQQDCKQQ